MSGGGSQTTNTTQEFKPPSYTQQPWQDFVTAGQDLASQPQQIYTGMTVAPLNGQQSQAQQFAEDRALTGAPDLNAARGSNMNISQGNLLSNPFQTTAYTDQAINDTANNMANAYATGTAADTASSAARGGAFGGSAYDQKQAMGAAGLANSIGQMGNQYRLQNQGQATNDYRSGVNQILGANQSSGQLSQDDWTAANALMNNGNQSNSYVQALLNANQNNWNQQQNYPAQQLGLLQQVLSAASGVGGSQIGQQGQSATPSWVTGGAGLASLLAAIGNH